MATLKAAIITDVHYGHDIKDKLGTKAPRLMKHFLKAVNHFDPAFIVDMGDRVSAVSEESDRENMNNYRAHFNEVAAPLHCLLGNHDIRNLGRGENEQITGSPGRSYSKDKQGYHFVFWNPEYVFGKTGIELTQKDIDWLAHDLQKAKDKPAVVFSHVPLDNIKGEEKADVKKYYFWTEGKQVRKIMEDAGNVILCMAGHQHRNRYRKINDIHYITQQAFTSQWKSHYRIPSGTFSLLQLDDDKITLSRRGRAKKTFDLTPRFTVP